MRRGPLIRRLAGLTAALLGVPVVTLGLSVGTASAWGGGQVTTYSLPVDSYPEGIAAGSDGALWFTEQGGNSIGRITTAGVITTYTTGIRDPIAIAAGPDGALWFTNYLDGSTPSIGRITTAGAVTNYSDPSITYLNGIAAGPNGALWFTNGIYGDSSIGRITTAGAVISYTDPSISWPMGITTGPDGALWFTNLGNNSIGRITTAGAVTNYTDPSIRDPYGIAAGPDGALWFTNSITNHQGGIHSSIGRITTAGAVTNYTSTSTTSTVMSSPEGIAAGPDGALWFANSAFNDSIGRITTDGAYTTYTNYIMNPSAIVAGPDGAMWFTNQYYASIGRITTNVTPKIISLTPGFGPVGTRVTITGRNLSGAIQVAFNGVPARILSDNATKIVTKVPAGATRGHVSVTTLAGTATSTGAFRVT